jgi:hypothetical protein
VAIKQTAAIKQPVQSMPSTVHDLLRWTTGLWWESETYTPPLDNTYAPAQQVQHEATLASFQETMITELQNPPRSRQGMDALKARVFVQAAAIARSVLEFDNSHLAVIMVNGFDKAVPAFAQEARRFDPLLSGDDVFQAGRNAWTMYGLQVLLGLPVRLTPSVFAYSMLYPYTDNYLDDPQVPESTKLAFSDRFRRRLTGDRIAPANTHEQRVFDLVAMIEGEFDRSCYPQVHQSLLAIHTAQDRSIRLLRRNVSPYEVDVLGITMEKGGTSVLADGYLVAGTLTPQQSEFLFGWGALMQLLDDLQDVAEDSQAGLMTVFSKSARRGRLESVLERFAGSRRAWPLDALTNRTLHFAYRVLERLDSFSAPGTEPFKDLMRRAAILSLLSAAGQAERLYTAAYVREIEQHMPVRFSFLSRTSAFARRQASLKPLIETFARTAGSALTPES